MCVITRKKTDNIYSRTNTDSGGGGIDVIAEQAWLRPAGTKGFRSKASQEGKGNSAAKGKGKGEKKERGMARLNLPGMVNLHKGKELNKQNIFIEEANTSLL
jgi:hypothetical protein